jgi:hypothetical protein
MTDSWNENSTKMALQPADLFSAIDTLMALQTIQRQLFRGHRGQRETGN